MLNVSPTGYVVPPYGARYLIYEMYEIYDHSESLTVESYGNTVAHHRLSKSRATTVLHNIVLIPARHNL